MVGADEDGEGGAAIGVVVGVEVDGSSISEFNKLIEPIMRLKEVSSTELPKMFGEEGWDC